MQPLVSDLIKIEGFVNNMSGTFQYRLCLVEVLAPEV